MPGGFFAHPNPSDAKVEVLDVRATTDSQRVNVPFRYHAGSVEGQEPGVVRPTTYTSGWQLKPQELK